ncbi:uncharacterized protein METZ01_LOCUS361828, partial [marine metagenome]
EDPCIWRIRSGLKRSMKLLCPTRIGLVIIGHRHPYWRPLLGTGKLLPIGTLHS